MRDDIARAYALLDSKGQASITGMRAPANVKKALQKLEELLPDEQVLAVAAGSEPTGVSQIRRCTARGSVR